MIQFSASPSPEQIQQLLARGARITSHVPDAALVVAGGDDISWDGLDLSFVGRLDELDKLSAELAAEQTAAESTGSLAIVEFHNDVDMNDARALVRERNVEIIERENLLPYQLLVAGPMDAVMRLAQWDEVAYIFPASAELAGGDDVRACAGAITDQGPIAQYVKAGPGWPQIGAPGSALELGYAFGELTSKLPDSTVQAEILRAFGEWAKNANLKFLPGRSASDPRTINIFFASGSHGDRYAFDGPGKVLAHTFYPQNAEPVAGDMHFDADEAWRTGASVDLFSVALHEAGHALGLAHSDKPSAVMYPFYRQTSGLAADDIAGIQALYGAARESTSAGVTPTPTPAPASAISITIASPSANFTTSAASVTVSGTVSGGTGTLRVTWANDHGGSGAASGSPHWTIASLPLTAAVNHITILATDAAGKTASKTIVVTRNAPSAQGDTVAPVVQILSPGSVMLATSAPSISLSGITSDNVAVTAVRWTNTFGGEGAAIGTTNWQVSNIPLLVGTTKITVHAFDAAGNSGAATITVVRR